MRTVKAPARCAVTLSGYSTSDDNSTLLGLRRCRRAAAGSGLVLLEATVVNVALPALERSLAASLAGLQWTVNAFTLTLSALILLGGALGDRFGRRRIYLIGIAWFAALRCCADSLRAWSG